MLRVFGCSACLSSASGACSGPAGRSSLQSRPNSAAPWRSRHALEPHRFPPLTASRSRPEVGTPAIPSHARQHLEAPQPSTDAAVPVFGPSKRVYTRVPALVGGDAELLEVAARRAQGRAALSARRVIGAQLARAATPAPLGFRWSVSERSRAVVAGLVELTGDRLRLGIAIDDRAVIHLYGSPP